ncbi:MAG: class I SAM-dependent methyltransferase [Actinomycetota bacterium]
MGEYSYDMAWEQERERLRGIEAWHDPGTIDVMRRLGVGIDWRCLEVGAGGGSIAEWLCDRAEHVVAIDLDTRFVERIETSNIEVRKLDIVAEPIEEESFDLVHSRMLLEHLPARDDVLKKLVGATRPGGFIFIEDLDFSALGYVSWPAFPERAAELLTKGTDAIVGIMTANGFDAGFARRLPVVLRSLGLSEVTAEENAALIYGGSDGAAFTTLSIKQLAPILAQSKAMEQGEIDELIALTENPESSWMSPPVIRAWGRKT